MENLTKENNEIANAPVLNKETLVSLVAEKTGTTKVQTRAIVEEIFASVSDCLAKGGKFQYIGFGTFHVKTRAARKGLNPRTKENLEIPAKKIPVFSPGKNLRDKVQA